MWRDGCSSSPDHGFAASSEKIASSWSFPSLPRVLIRGPISVQGQFDLHTGSGRNWREPVLLILRSRRWGDWGSLEQGSWRREKGCSLSLASCAHLGCCCAHLCGAGVADGKRQVMKCCEGQGENLSRVHRPCPRFPVLILLQLSGQERFALSGVVVALGRDAAARPAIPVCRNRPCSTAGCWVLCTVLAGLEIG